MPSSAAVSDHADSLLPFDDIGACELPQEGLEPWRVLIVDDDEDVHVATELAMRDLPIEGRRVAFLHAHSAAEALNVVAADPAISTVLLDVVMETPDAGLRLVRQIREELGRSALRIILRTGQPGYAPEIETLRAFDINDYRTKSELTRVRLFSSLTAAIRSYAQLTDILDQRDKLAQMNESLQQARAAERAENERRLTAEAALKLANASVEQCVAQRTQELSQAITELDAFNRMVSHDLSGPLHGLAGLSGLIRHELDQGDPAKVRRWVSMMETQTRRLAELVADLLSLARISEGTVHRSPVALNGVVQEALQALSTHTPAHRIASVSVGTLPELAVDATLMRQVFVNLLSNALKFTADTPSPRIEVQAQRSDDAWTFTVSDNGAGFDAHRAVELFKPFSRLHGARFEGSGIGLTIVQRIVARHGGQVWAHGQPGNGASFQFSLPIQP